MARSVDGLAVEPGTVVMFSIRCFSSLTLFIVYYVRLFVIGLSVI